MHVLYGCVCFLLFFCSNLFLELLSFECFKTDVFLPSQWFVHFGVKTVDFAGVVFTSGDFSSRYLWALLMDRLSG